MAAVLFYSEPPNRCYFSLCFSQTSSQPEFQIPAFACPTTDTIAVFPFCFCIFHTVLLSVGDLHCTCNRACHRKYTLTDYDAIGNAAQHTQKIIFFPYLLPFTAKMIIPEVKLLFIFALLDNIRCRNVNPCNIIQLINYVHSFQQVGICVCFHIRTL